MNIIKNEERIEKARIILLNQDIEITEFLGLGHEGVVFRSKKNVYKVIMPIVNKTIDFESVYRRKSFFVNLDKPLKHLYSIKLIKTENSIIIKYPYEKGTKSTSYTEEDAISVLTELWQKKIIILDCKPENCIRVNGILKVIDLDGNEYNDNLFLNMCARMYLYANYYRKINHTKFQKIKRSAINNFELSELKGLRDFVNRVFTNIIFEESRHINYRVKGNKNVIHETIKTTDNLEDLFFTKIKENKYLTGVHFDGFTINRCNYFEPENLKISYKHIAALEQKVSLLIKTCPQDTDTIEENIKHIIKQLSTPNSFHEIVVSIDTREKDFLREYNSKGSLNELENKIQKLKDKNIIDRIIIFNHTKTRELNKLWFNLDSDSSHTISKAPLAPQLYAFEQCRGDYILQMDSDVLIGRKDYNHSYLSEMLLEFEKDENVISVGFNIPNEQTNDYFGFENGGFVPEVRMGLLHKERIYGLFPLPNTVNSNGTIQLTWQQSLLLKQKQAKAVSIRGGNHRSFYIHPQNYRKKEAYAWLTILDKVEQNIIPNFQFGKFDVVGSLYDWSMPKRNEKLIVVSCFRNVSIDRFLRMWSSLISQDFSDFGIILLDDNSDNGLPYFIDSLIKPHLDKVTFIKKRNRSTRMENVYRAIHYYVSNSESIIVMLDGDDAFIGNKVLTNIVENYEAYEADVAVGRFHQTYRLQPHYRYPVNFSSPRTTGGNVWQHVKTFKKYLFDSIPLTHFKYSDDSQKLYNSKWLQACDDFAFMVPILEMSKQPIQLENINYFYERNYEKRNERRRLKEECIAEILNKPILSSRNVFKERKTFIPNLQKIEIDITYDCNLKCLGCNRSCTQAPSSEMISLKEIRKYVEEWISLKKKWDLINVLGGEPTIHPNFEAIIQYVHEEYIGKFSSSTLLQIVSNGYSEKSRKLCEELRIKYSNVRIDYGSFKTNKVVEYFSPFNDAPIDDEKYRNADFSKACWVTSYCGIGLNNHGYYACAVAGGIDRIVEKKMAIPNLSELSIKKLKEQLNEFCRYCGNYKAYEENFGNFIPRVEKEPFKNVITESWKKAYKRYYEQ